jgi:hypothetical protein
MNERYGKKVMGRGLLSATAMLVGLLFSMQVQAACTAANPNASVVEDTPTSAFTDNGDGTVTHSLTGLMWKQCAEGLSGADCATGGATAMNWSGALAMASSDSTAGYGDWRLPNQRELLSIVETCGYSPTINQTLFPNTPASSFWSTSSYVPNLNLAWYVYFYNGDYGPSVRAGNSLVRLVRGGQLLDTFDALAPSLTAVGVSGTSVSGTTLAATSDIAATGYWMVVPQGSAAPTAAEVKAGSNYGVVTVAAAGSGSMSAATEATFAISGLNEATAYDVYLVGYDANNKALTYTPSSAAFTTLPDGDGDGVADVSDNCPVDANADQLDTDSDGAGNVCDTDDDNDGVLDVDDAFPLDATRSSAVTSDSCRGHLCNFGGSGAFNPLLLFTLLGSQLLFRRRRG